MRILRARVLMATAILFLPAAATTCPAGWTPSPASAARGQRCFLVPPERSTSLFYCIDLCQEHGGTPACISSAEENTLATELAAGADYLWLGLYQNETGSDPAKGWNRCMAGDAPSFTNWHESQPDELAGYQEDCAFLAASAGSGSPRNSAMAPELGTGQWGDQACDAGFDSFLDPFPCLCARGNASAAFADDLGALEATRGYNQRLLKRRTVIGFAAAIAVAILPTLLLLGRAGWRRLRRGADAESSAGAFFTGYAGAFFTAYVTSPSRSATAAALNTPECLVEREESMRGIFHVESSGAASSAKDVRGKLRAARVSATGRRLRVSFAMFQAGWALTVMSLSLGSVMDLAGQSIDAAIGNGIWWLLPLPLGLCLLLLALFPTDARAIRVSCAAVLLLLAGLEALTIRATLAGKVSEVFGSLRAALFFAAAGVLAPTLRCRGVRAMQPRPALRRLWAVIRLSFLGWGVLFAAHGFANYVKVRLITRLASSVAFLLCAALATPRNRGRIHRRLGRLGGRGTEAEEAAAVAALVGGSDPDAALDRASQLFRCLPASRLHAADLADNTTSSSAGPTLHERTEPAMMGQVTAFLSHSWRDEDEAPGAKHAVVSRWAKRCQEKTGKEPTLWLDKACIHQGNIEESLACLPVFLAGCQTLLVVAGPTYCSRLWCVMELFTFARMGGDQECVEVHLNAYPDDDQTEARRLLTEQFATFDAGKARCFLASEREHLLAVIEAGFGDFHDFNRVARSLLLGAVLPGATLFAAALRLQAAARARAVRVAQRCHAQAVELLETGLQDVFDDVFNGDRFQMSDRSATAPANFHFKVLAKSVDDLSSRADVEQAGKNVRGHLDSIRRLISREEAVQLLTSAAQRIREPSYSLRDFHADMTKCFPELQLYLGGIEPAADTVEASAAILKSKGIFSASTSSAGAGSSSGRTGHVEYCRTFGALFCVYWLMRLELDEVQGSAGLGGQSGFCFGANEDMWEATPLPKQADQPPESTGAVAPTEESKKRAFLLSHNWLQLHALMVDAGLLTHTEGGGAVVCVERTRAMLALTAIHDVMKIECLLPTLLEAHAPFGDYQAGEQIRDHDAALGYVLTYDPDALPGYADLPPEQRAPVRFTQAELSFNHGWLVQAEAPPGVLLSKFKSLLASGGMSSADVAFYFVHWLTDLGGAEGTPLSGAEKFVVKFPHAVLNSFIRSFPVVQQLATLTETELMERFLVEWWPDGLGPTPSGPEAVALMRLVVHVQSPAAHATVVEAFNLLPAGDRTTLATEMARTGIDGQAYSADRSPQAQPTAGGPAFLLYYAPAFLRQSVGNALAGLRVLAGVYRAARVLFPLSEGIEGTVLVYIDQLKAGGAAESLCNTAQHPSPIWILVRKSERECVVQNHTVFDERMLLSSPPTEPYQVLKIDTTLLAVPAESTSIV